MIKREAEAVYPDPARSGIRAVPTRFVVTLLLVLLIYGSSLYFVDFDVSRLWSGLPRLAHWAGKAWPPDIREFGVLIERAVETLAMAVITGEQATAILPKHYTGFIASSHANYKLIEDAGLAVGALKSQK